MDPNATAQACPIRTIDTALTGVNPISTKMGETIATGTPKPAMPCMNPEKAHPTIKACISGSFIRRVIVEPIILIPASPSITL